MNSIVVDPLSNVLYQSFYIQALYDSFGKRNVRFGNKPFESLSQGARTTCGMTWVFQSDYGEKRFFVDAGDSYRIQKELYEWCDVYGKVNTNYIKTPGLDKLVCLCPSFGVRCWPIPVLLHYAITNTARYLIESHTTQDWLSMKHFIGRYRRLLLRVPIDLVVPGKSEDNYVFFCSTLWYSNEWNQNDENVNLRRAHFIRVCKSLPDIQFEGGFVDQPGRSSRKLFEDCMSDRSYSHSDWVYKTQKSALVFNTPAFWDCHGWKLGEYLALGKAIISTPLSNDLPSPLQHGVNIHFVENDPVSIERGIKEVLSNPEYRHRLEIGAREYWERWGAMKSVLKLLSTK